MLSGPESLTVGTMDDDASEERITQMAHNSRSAELECVPMNQLRALRYRKLALQEPDKEKAQLLQLLADEADRGVLCAVEWTRHGSIIAIPIKSSEAKARTPYICENDLGWFDIRDLGAVLDHEGPLPHPASDPVQ
jgi:hypothetical protein